MAKITLSFHAIKLSLNRKETDLSTKIGGNTILDFFYNFFENKLPHYNSAAQTQDISQSQQLFLKAGTTAFVERTVREPNAISGILRYGSQGIASDLIDLKTTQKKYARQQTDLELIPFFFRVEIPTNGQIGYLILQGIGQNKIFTPVNSSIQREFGNFKKNNNTNAALKIEPIFIGKLFITKYISDGIVKKVAVSKYENRADLFEDNGENCKITTTIEAPSRNPFKKRINDIISQNHDDPNEIKIQIKSLLSMSDDMSSEMKIFVDYNGQVRSIDVDDFRKSATNYDITDIEKSIDGNPVFDRIKERSISILETHIKPLVR